MQANIEVFLCEEKIRHRVAELAGEISKDYAGHEVTLLCTLGGAVFFLADLSRALEIPVQIEYIKASSYGDGTEPGQKVNLEYTPGEKLAGKHVLWVEDIVDTGSTVVSVKKHLTELGPKSLKLVSLLDKPDRRQHKNVEIHYLGFTIPDKFVVGYGLDYAGKYRNLPYIGVLQA